MRSSIASWPPTRRCGRPSSPTSRRQVRARFGDLIPSHPLYRELLATDLAGEIIDQMGIVWAHETAAELDVTLPEVAGAFWTARQLLGANLLWAAGEEPFEGAALSSGDAEAAPGLSADAEAALHRMVAEAVDGLTRRYLLAGPGSAGARIDADGPIASEAAALPPTSARPQLDELQRLGVPSDLARRVDAATRLVNLADVAAIARRSGRTATDVLGIWATVEATAGLSTLVGAVTTLPTPNRWVRWQARGIIDDATSWCAATVAAGLARPAGDLEAWLSSRAPAFSRVRGLLANIGASPASALALASLAVRALPRDL